MQGLLADGWFYLSAASLLLSGVLFFFLLSQYRAAVEAADRAEDGGEGESSVDTGLLRGIEAAAPSAKGSLAKDEKEITTPLSNLKSPSKTIGF